jgi:hypothetical protein
MRTIVLAEERRPIESGGKAPLSVLPPCIGTLLVVLLGVFGRGRRIA